MIALTRTVRMNDSTITLYSIPQAARLLSISTKTLWRLVYARRIETIKIGRRVLIRRAALEALIESNIIPVRNNREFVRKKLGLLL